MQIITNRLQINFNRFAMRMGLVSSIRKRAYWQNSNRAIFILSTPNKVECIFYMIFGLPTIKTSCPKSFCYPV